MIFKWLFWCCYLIIIIIICIYFLFSRRKDQADSFLDKEFYDEEEVGLEKDGKGNGDNNQFYWTGEMD